MIPRVLAVGGLLALLAVPSASQPVQDEPRTFTLEELETMEPPGPNPYLSLLPIGDEIDWDYWRARVQYESFLYRSAPRVGVPPLSLTEAEPPGTFGTNDLPSFAEPLPGFGGGVGETPRAVVTGHLRELPVVYGPFAEPNGSIGQAGDLAVSPGRVTMVSDRIGDGLHGSGGAEPTGDFDVYRFPAAAGQRLEIAVQTPFPLADLNPVAGLYDSAGRLLAVNNDIFRPGFISTRDSFIDFTVVSDDVYYVTVGGFISMDYYSEAELLLLDPFDAASGPGAGSEGDYDLLVAVDHAAPPDVDHYRVDLRAGDVLGAGLGGDARRVALVGPDGEEKVAVPGIDLSGIYSDSSPLPGGSSAALAQVIDEPGVYTVRVDAVPGIDVGGRGVYTLELALARPPLDSAPDGAVQVLFLDFDGATFNADIFHDHLGDVRLSPLPDFLPRWGLATDAADAVIDAVVATVEENLSQDVRQRGSNGDFAASGQAGDFDIEIRNSRDHADPFGEPHVSRVIVGGTVDQLGLRLIGIAQSIDVGNFTTGETGVVLLDLLSEPSPDPNSLNTPQRVAGGSKIDLIGVGVGNVVAHEAGHFFGNFHTARLDFPGVPDVANVMDWVDLLGHAVGADLVFGTADDRDVDFDPDVYTPREGLSGTEDTLEVVAFGLPRGGSRPDVAVSPRAVEFGSLPPGDQATRTMTVSNVGSLPLTLFDVRLVGSAAGEVAFVAGGGGGVLAAGQARTVEVRFAPATTGVKHAAVEVSSDDADEGRIEIPLVGWGGVPDIAIDAVFHDYGELVYGDATLSASRVFHIANDDPGADLHVETPRFAGANPELFRVEDAGPFVLGPGEVRPLTVTFAPLGRVGDMSARLLVGSNDPDEDPVPVDLVGRALGPDIAVNPSGVFHFGGIFLGRTRSRTFRVDNLGQRDLTGTATLDGGNGQYVLENDGGFIVGAGEQLQLVVGFTPSTLELSTAVLGIASNDPDEGLLEVLLAGQGAVPEIVVDPAHLEFHAAVGVSASRTLRISNEGTEVLLGDLSVEGSPEFTLVRGGRFGLLPGGIRSLEVRFAPTEPGLRHAEVVIMSNDLDDPEIRVPLLGHDASTDPEVIPTLSEIGLALLALGLAAAALAVRRRQGGT